MEEGGKNAVDRGRGPVAAGAPAVEGKRRAPLYLLAACGVLAAAGAFHLSGKQTAAGQQAAVAEPARPAPAPAGRVAIDATATIDRVMTEHYGKYSKEERGWLYVADDKRTYVMRVIQEAKLTDGAAGDVLYFLASGDGKDGEPLGKVGAFHVRQDPDKPGRLLTLALPDRFGGSYAPDADNVRFVDLGGGLRGWVVTVHEGLDGEDYLVADNVVLAPQGKRIVELATFPASRRYDAGEDCGSISKAHAQAAARAANAADDATMPQETLADHAYLCQARTWTYRIDTSAGGVPGPISVTAGGTLDGKPVPAETWELAFDPTAYRYQVPKALALDD